MTVTIHVADTIRCVARGLPQRIVVVTSEGKTLRQLALEAGVPPILIVFAIVDGVKKGLDEVVVVDAQIHFHGTIAGG